MRGRPAMSHRIPAPLWRRPMTWWVTLYMGLQSAAFYTMSNWLPSVSAGAGVRRGERRACICSCSNSIGIVSGLLVPMLMQVGGNQVCAALVSSLPMVVAYVGMLTLPQAMMVWSVIGGCGAGRHTGGGAVADRVARHHRAGDRPIVRYRPGSLGYLLASIGPAAFGMLAELSGAWAAPLLLALALARGAMRGCGYLSAVLVHERRACGRCETLTRYTDRLCSLRS